VSRSLAHRTHASHRTRAIGVRLLGAVASGLLLATLSASASAGGDERAAQARAAFVEGTSFVQKSQWAEAIDAFERAGAIAPHAVTTYNLGACERATGHFTSAYTRFKTALAQHAASGEKELSPALVAETKTFLAELDTIMVRVNMRVEPDGATLAVDGRPLALLDAAANPPVLVTSRRAPPGELPPPRRFAVLLDPGAHVFVFARKGFSNAVVNRTFRPGETTDLSLSLDLLPATVHVGSNRPRAVVSIDGVDVGPAPAELRRPAGNHEVVVREPGFTSYVTRLSLSPGEDARLEATLAPEKPSIFSRWWFWTAAGVVVTGAAVTTYALTRPEPQRAPVGTGTLGWSVSLP
jgi:hypothetical protein